MRVVPLLVTTFIVVPLITTALVLYRRRHGYRREKMKFVYMVFAALLGTSLVLDGLRGRTPRQVEVLMFLFWVLLTIWEWRKDAMKSLERLIWMTILSLFAGVLLAETTRLSSWRDQLLLLGAPLILVLILVLIFRNHAVRSWWEGKASADSEGR